MPMPQVRHCPPPSSALLGSELTLVAGLSGSPWGRRSIRLEERDEAGLVDGPLGPREANQQGPGSLPHPTILYHQSDDQTGDTV
jgi:hypothetical protein